MQKITPHLWFDKQALEAAEFYVAAFPGSQIKSRVTLDGTPSGPVDIVNFELLGLEFQAISAGPEFQFNPSVSFLVLCNTPAQVDALWERLSAGGMALMELGAYPFSERFGWLQDRYGLSWQLFYSGAPDAKPGITPVLMFVGEVCGRAEEAIRFWTSIFPGSQILSTQYYGEGEEPERAGTLRQATFSLAGQEFRAMDSAHDHRFAFNEAISFIIDCENQGEVDRYWDRLSAVPEAEQCGWLKDRFGFSWQVIPTGIEEMFQGDDRERIDRVTQVMLQMKKLDLGKLKEAYLGVV